MPAKTPKKPSAPKQPKKPTSKSKTGNSACSQAASNWQLAIRGKEPLDPNTYKTLAQCRSMTAQKKSANLAVHSGKLNEQGRDALVGRLQKRADQGLLYKKDREARLNMLLKERKAKQAAAPAKPDSVSQPSKQDIKRSERINRRMTYEGIKARAAKGPIHLGREGLEQMKDYGLDVFPGKAPGTYDAYHRITSRPVGFIDTNTGTVVAANPKIKIDKVHEDIIKKSVQSSLNSETRKQGTTRSDMYVFGRMAGLKRSEYDFRPAPAQPKPAAPALKPEPRPEKAAIDWRSAEIGPNSSETYVQAKKQSDGKYKLFHIGTRNEVFHGATFASAHEAKNVFKWAREKHREAAKQSAAQPKPAAPAFSLSSGPQFGTNGKNAQGVLFSTPTALDRQVSADQAARGKPLAGQTSMFDKPAAPVSREAALVQKVRGLPGYGVAKASATANRELVGFRMKEKAKPPAPKFSRNGQLAPGRGTRERSELAESLNRARTRLNREADLLKAFARTEFKEVSPGIRSPVPFDMNGAKQGLISRFDYLRPVTKLRKQARTLTRKANAALPRA